MKLNQIEIFINAHNEIAMKQVHSEGCETFELVRITADQADMVADEIKRLGKELKEEESQPEVEE